MPNIAWRPKSPGAGLYYETMESVLGKTDKTVIEAQGVTPYLPLPEVAKRARTAPAQPTGIPPAGGQ